MRVFDFDHAILRAPARSVVDGLRAHDGPSPSFEGVAAEHRGYATALADAGVAVDMLAPLEDFPDSLFVEDPALTFPEGAILLRPGTRTRLGEAAHLRTALERHFSLVREIDEGHADGGDVLVTPDLVLIGLSARTDRVGAEALVRALGAIGRKARVVLPPEGALHLKTAVSLIDEDSVLTTRAGADSGLFAGLRQIVVPAGEEAAANALRVNDRLFVGSQFPATLAMLVDEGVERGYAVVPLDTRQIGLIDAGLSCMSLRWSGRQG
ncbi:dimethylarginine dimethylaminohydrolase family protein [Novosphingobium sp.]|uniref:dimethylarginine dimethylaminohydrolase family protein n=1 Tax=Novosphingobium sp. TaxID=1874826 RepID=UPI003D0A66D7